MNSRIDPIARLEKQKGASRFWSKVNKDGAGGCWLWIGGNHGDGYGTFWYKDRVTLAHRAAWLITRGLIPSGCHILHKCDNPSCVNPDHLFLGDQAVNNADMCAKGRDNKDGLALGSVSHRNRSHCIHGHPLSGSNLYLKKDGRRQCKQCQCVSERKWRAKCKP